MGTDNGLLERIAGARTRVVALTGPAASGKTAAALGLYRRYAGDDLAARCLLIAPNAPAAAAMREALLEAACGVLAGPGVMTFAGMAERILGEAGRAARAISPFERHLLLARIVEELAAGGGLGALAAVADTPGLIAALDRSIAELKRAAIEPDSLARALGGERGKAADLLAVYRRYQDALRADALYDVEGRMWEARDCLSRTGEKPLPLPLGTRALAVDGFTDFTPTQLEILRRCSLRLERLLITLPWAPDGRDRLWHWTARTLAAVRAAFGADLTEIAVARPAEPPLAVVWDRLFNPDAPACPRPAGLALAAAPDVDAEVTEAARRVKRLLADGCPPAQIALAARAMEPYRPAVERIFAAADIPVAPGARALTDEPIVRFLLDAAALGPEFAFRDVLRVVKNSYFRPQALGDYNAVTVAAAEMVIREGNVLAGRDAYARAALRLAGAPKRGPQDEDDAVTLGASAFQPADLKAAADMLEKLFDASTRAVDPAALLALADTLQLRQAACDQDAPQRVARDLRALTALRGCLANLTPPYPSPARLTEALASVSAATAAAPGGVLVSDVLDLRALRRRHVFLLGLGEGQFPPRFSDSPMLGEAQRTAWASRGLALDCRGDLAAREMLLFYLAVSRCDESLTLSYLEPEGGGLGAGGFLEALLEPTGGLAKFPTDRVAPGQPAPADADGRLDEARLLTPGEALLAAAAGLFSRDLTGGQSALAWAAAHAPEPLTRAAMGIFARARRWQPGGADRFDGRIDDPSLQEALAKQFGPEHVFSASALNMMGTCPWHFFARYVLNLEPLGEPERQLEAQGRGIFLHDVLRRTFALLAGEARAVRLDQVDPARCREALDEAIAEQAALVENRRPPYPALWKIQLDRMAADLAKFLDRQRSHPLAPESLRFELSFGLDDVPGEGCDEGSLPEPVVIDTPAGPIRLHGRIDRVDRVRACGQEGLFVVDYKSGSIPSKDDLQAGRNLQIPLYAEAASQLLDEPALGGLFCPVGSKQSGRYFAAVEVARGKPAPRPDYQQARQAMLALAGEFVERARQGRFDLPTTEVCTSWCQYRRICQFSQARAAVKEASRAR